MPRYYFNVYDGQESIDNEGVVFESRNIARKEAINYAGALLEEAETPDGFSEGWRMEVLDEDKRLVLKVTFLVEDFFEQPRRAEGSA